MCGICGIAHADGSREVDAGRLETMMEAMVHRGPDDAGLWRQGPIGLGMRRLSVLDLAGGHQPMFNEDGSVVVAFNGEIYNFAELRADLETQGHIFSTNSDTEVIVHAYEAYGDDALKRFNGMFAFALYDANRDRLVVARDRLGIKPLYYSFREGALVFASELDCLVQAGAVSGRLNPAALDAYFAYLYIPAPDSVFEDARKLRPGECLIFENKRLRTLRYWQPRFDPKRSWTLDSAAATYGTLLADSVCLRRISDVPLGAFLSGGLDSMSVVGMMSRAGNGPVKTFTIGFDDAHANELEYARVAANHFETEHTEAVLTPDMVSVSSALARHFGEPFADSSAVPMWLVSKVAREQVTVALSGDGGDELFAGYTWLHMARKVAGYRYLPEPIRRLLDTALRLLPNAPFAEKVRRFSGDSFLAPMEGFRRRQTCFTAGERASLYGPELAECVAASAADRFGEHMQAGMDLGADNAMLHQDTVMYLPDDILTKVDRMTMAHSLEARVPLLDHRIVEFAATVPFRLKYAGGVSKRLAKHAVREWAPPALLAQRKRGFALPIHRWFREDLAPLFNDLVLGDDALCHRFLSRDAMDRMAQAHREGRGHYGHHLWTLLMFEHWLRYVSEHIEVSLA